MCRTLFNFVGVCVFTFALAMTALPQEGKGREKYYDRLSVLNAAITAKNVELHKTKSNSSRTWYELAAMARERFDILDKVAENDPAAVLRGALPAQVLDSIPADLQSLFEKRGNVEGELEVIAECEEHDGRIHRFLKQGDTRLSLAFTDEPSGDLLTGATVVINGVLIGDEVVAESDGMRSAVSKTDAADAESNSLAGTTGEKKVLVILVNFQDNTSQPYTTDHPRSIVFDSGSNFIRENSYGQTWLTGDVYGWYTIPISGASCDTAAIGNYARQAAAAAGANLASYQHYVYGFPSTSTCGFSGRSSVGGSPSHLWVNSNLMGVPVFAHEFGHSLGLFHSQSIDCGVDVIPGSCTANEYGDVFDIMGISKTVHMSAFQKERLGWLNAGAVQEVTSSGTYFVDAYETVSAGVKSIKMLKSIDPTTGSRTWYYLEHRTPTGFDTSLGNYGVQNGVVVHIGSESYGTENYLLDMTPATTSWYDATLNVGQTFADPAARISFTVLSADNNGATVQVEMNAQSCARANPSVTVTPGQTQGLTSGTTFNYNVSVSNNDGAGCSASSFNLQPNVPAGWTASHSASTLNVAPGGSSSVTLSVTSPAGAADGSYSVGSTAYSGSYSSTSSASYVIVSGLSVSAISSASSYTLSQSARVTATVRAGGAPVAGTVVSFTMTKSNGVVVAGTSLTDASGNALFQYSFNRKKDPLGIYTVRAQSSSNGYSGNGTVSFTVKAASSKTSR